GRTAQFGSAIRSWRLRFRRLDLAAFDARRLDARSDFRSRNVGSTGSLAAMRMRPRRCAGHEHLSRALMMKITIGEAHARHRAAKAALVLLVEIEARLERQPAQRGTNGLAANLQRVAGKADMADRSLAGKLHRASSAHIVKD